MSALNIYGQNLVEMARKLDPIIGREEEISRIINILSKRTKNNPVLVGKPRVGKTAVVEGLVKRIVNVTTHDLAKVRVVSLNMGALVAGTQYRCEFEQRFKAVLEEVEETRPKVILSIDEIHLVIGAGRTKECSTNSLTPSKASLVEEFLMEMTAQDSCQADD